MVVLMGHLPSLANHWHRWKDMRMRIIIGIGICVLIVVIVVPIVKA